MHFICFLFRLLLSSVSAYTLLLIKKVMIIMDHGYIPHVFLLNCYLCRYSISGLMIMVIYLTTLTVHISRCFLFSIIFMNTIEFKCQNMSHDQLLKVSVFYTDNNPYAWFSTLPLFVGTLNFSI